MVPAEVAEQLPIGLMVTKGVINRCSNGALDVTFTFKTLISFTAVKISISDNT